LCFVNRRRLQVGEVPQPDQRGRGVGEVVEVGQGGLEAFAGLGEVLVQVGV
jgi:hypothetical protein